MEQFIVLAVIIWAVWSFVVRSKRRAAAGKKPSQGSAHIQRGDLSMLPERFVVLDCETTGLQPERHEIIELAAIRVNRDSDDHETFSALVQPRGRISSKITSITGLDRKILEAEGLEIGIVLRQFREFVGDLPLVAFNAEFDMGFLHSECDRASLPRFHNKWDCALKVARKAWPERSSYRLGAICREAGVTVGSEHRALPDCHRALLVYVAAVQSVGRCSIGR